MYRTDVIACLIILLIGVVVSFLITLRLGFPLKGEHTGYITAVEKDGLFQIGVAYFKTETESSQEDTYCLSDDMYTKAQEVSREKQLVTVNYSRGWFVPVWECGGNGIQVVGIEIK